ncbi:HAD-IB family hydrolase [uncultured Bacteroides sp.]|uniref:HAD-IB family hydrolase n=1 Tax=uncultured Bacteroides sp. TaxID=162156 RepID=UPI0008223FEE|nr:HAD-IB family hydrolase [uncultured Bacteroides sp.]SCH60476.1 phosphoserine phosphatase [uncultured Bacteroides sp.]
MDTIVAFDFDGTITRKDTLLEFIKFAKGNIAFYTGFCFYMPILLAYKLGLYPNWKVKQKIFTYFFRGTSLVDFNKLCNDFFLERGRNLIYLSAVDKIRKHLEQHDKVMIISASIENWVEPFARYLGIDYILCTQVETDLNGILTGAFLTSNCYGAEKVKRLVTFFPDRKSYYLIVYGDSKGDRELLAYADEKYYKLFQ